MGFELVGEHFTGPPDRGDLFLRSGRLKLDEWEGGRRRAPRERIRSGLKCPSEFLPTKTKRHDGQQRPKSPANWRLRNFGTASKQQRCTREIAASKEVLIQHCVNFVDFRHWHGWTLRD